jgi:hypothetical protein
MNNTRDSKKNSIVYCIISLIITLSCVGLLIDRSTIYHNAKSIKKSYILEN